MPLMSQRPVPRPVPRNRPSAEAFSRQQPSFERRLVMTLGTVLLIILTLILIGALPTWGHSRSWGYMPSGVVGVVVVILIVLLLTGRL